MAFDITAKNKEWIRLTLILFWLVFTVSFAIWWFTLSLDHISVLARLQPERIEHWQSQKRMIFWEGIAWIGLLALGGGALIALVQKEKKRGRQIREFFASFSHEVKTSLSSLRLQAEALKDDLRGQESEILDRLVGDTVRLQLQLENSLFLASQSELKLYLQPLSLAKICDRMREQWPGLNLALSAECTLEADERAVRTIFSNLIQNALIHGQATEVVLTPRSAPNGRVKIEVVDNGKGFEGSTDGLGELFHRAKSTSGSGLGLYISRLLLRHMQGQLELYPKATGGFRANVILRGRMTGATA
ncbi:MAG: sensor histidine kinase [Bdellovibrionales bacterium]